MGTSIRLVASEVNRRRQRAGVFHEALVTAAVYRLWNIEFIVGQY